MKDWMCWVLVIVGVAVILGFSWWLTAMFNTMTIYYITIVLNGIIFGYLLYQGKTKA